MAGAASPIRLPFAGLIVLGASLVACAPSDGRNVDESTGNVRSAIVGGELSTAADDFVLFLSQATQPDRSCGASLVAPNLVVTAKHCVYQYVSASESFCDGTGEPMVGSTGGYVGAPVPVVQIGLYAGVDGKRKFQAGEAPIATATKIIDDRTTTLCSHDMAFVVLDKAVTGLPLAKLQLAKRPTETSKIAIAGWGQLENRESTTNRFRRSGMTIERVGAPAPLPGAAGTTLGPMTFETGPGACTGDSGSPGFVAETGTTLGVIARALNLDKSDPISPCRPETVQIVFVTVIDFPKVVREAFAEAKAEPWQEGNAAPGWTKFGEACASDLQCEGGLCAASAGAGAGAKTCNLDCTSAGKVCPSGYVCGATSKSCEIAPPAPPPDTTAPTGSPTAPGATPEPEVEARASGCNAAPVATSMHSAPVPGGAGALAACVALTLAVRMSRRSRRAS